MKLAGVYIRVCPDLESDLEVRIFMEAWDGGWVSVSVVIGNVRVWCGRL